MKQAHATGLCYVLTLFILFHIKLELCCIPIHHISLKYKHSMSQNPSSCSKISVCNHLQSSLTVKLFVFCLYRLHQNWKQDIPLSWSPVIHPISTLKSNHWQNTLLLSKISWITLDDFPPSPVFHLSVPYHMLSPNPEKTHYSSSLSLLFYFVTVQSINIF